jgi:hypothetical protein
VNTRQWISNSKCYISLQVHHHRPYLRSIDPSDGISVFSGEIIGVDFMLFLNNKMLMTIRTYGKRVAPSESPLYESKPFFLICSLYSRWCFLCFGFWTSVRPINRMRAERVSAFIYLRIQLSRYSCMICSRPPAHGERGGGGPKMRSCLPLDVGSNPGWS